MTLNEEKALKNYIKGLVREAMFDMGYMQENDIEEKKQKKAKRHHKISRNGAHHRHREIMTQRRAAVIKALDTEKDEKGEIKLDVAPYAYKLWPDKDEASARSYFYKKLKGEPNQSGVPYKFSDAEINRLYSMISNNAM